MERADVDRAADRARALLGAPAFATAFATASDRPAEDVLAGLAVQ
jgi:hypothetical protein